MVFEDPHFGSPYDHSLRLAVPQEVRQQIADRLKQEIEAQKQHNTSTNSESEDVPT